MTDTASDPFAGVEWIDCYQQGLEGRAWEHEIDPEFPGSRLPLRAKLELPAKTWARSLDSAGMVFNFRTDATEIFGRWTPGSDDLGDHIFPAGLDLYGRDDGGPWQWVGHKAPWRFPTSDGRLHQLTLDGKEREYRLYAPLRAPTRDLAIGTRGHTKFAPIAPRPIGDRQGIVYYGTSIVHGVGVARGGMSHANRLNRAFEMPLLNLGLAGCAKCEPIIARLLGELDPALFLLDPLPNMNGELVTERLETFLDLLRAARPETPIIWVGDRILTDHAFIPKRQELHADKSVPATAIIERRIAAGDRHLYRIPGGHLFGDDTLGAYDASHPNEIGAARMADTLIGFIRRHDLLPTLP